MIYKICGKDEWAAAALEGAFTGSETDTRDGFIHFSRAPQVAGTLAKYYAGANDLVLVAVDESKLGKALRLEPSRGGELFPHLYAALAVSDVVWVKPLKHGPDGTFVLPADMK